ncbi:MAG: rod shape-determining protein RodA [candidate division Zixibacteria bacterium]|jgi:rod shape determining protein RodA|nr:rod shape-determining protein RodA [candidate division Zixibacteria bacterium]
MKISRLKLDSILAFVPIILSIIGIIFIYSATKNSAITAEHTYFEKQILWLMLGIGLAIVLYFIPLKVHEVMAYVYYGAAIFLLVLVLFVSKSGAARWFNIGGLGLQPAEFAKFAVCIVLSRFFVYRQLKIKKFSTIVIALLIVIIPTLLIVKQPDLGSSLVGLATYLTLLVWTGMPISRIILIVSPVISLITAFHWVTWIFAFAAFLMLLYISRPGITISILFLLVFIGFGMATPYLWNRLHEYQRQRVLTFLDPGQDPSGSGYHVIQSKIAIGSGGIIGRGFMKGTQTKLDYLPERHTDFIYSVISEELGFVGSIMVLLLFSLIIVRGFMVAYKARNPFNSYVAAGLTGAVAFQTLVNIGMTVGLMPVTGVPLPFVSYGGSSMLYNWALIGVILAINRDWQEY